MKHNSEVLIVGGGVIGCAIARELSLSGRKCTILERGEPCREASWAAAGALIARALGPDEGPLLEFKIQSLSMFKQFCQELTGETGIDTGFRETGGIDFLIDADEAASVDVYLDWQRIAGVPAEKLSAADLHRLEPNLSPNIQLGVLFPTFTQVRTPWFTKAVLTSALRHGADLQTHTDVREFLVEGGRVVGVRTDQDEWHAGLTILATGAWSPQMARLLGKELPGVPVKGQIILLHDRSRPIQHIVHHGKTYITPRDEGRLVVGSTEEWVGFQRENTLDGIAGLLQHAKEFYPCLGSASVEHVWHGFRPLTYDGLPFLGGLSGLEGLLCATGHYRSGIILSPLTAKVVGEMVDKRKPSFDVKPFSPDRAVGMGGVDMTPRADLH
jgi:glycine oxidase